MPKEFLVSLTLHNFGCSRLSYWDKKSSSLVPCIMDCWAPWYIEYSRLATARMHGVCNSEENCKSKSTLKIYRQQQQHQLPPPAHPNTNIKFQKWSCSWLSVVDTSSSSSSSSGRQAGRLLHIFIFPCLSLAWSLLFELAIDRHAPTIWTSQDTKSQSSAKMEYSACTELDHLPSFLLRNRMEWDHVEIDKKTTATRKKYLVQCTYHLVIKEGSPSLWKEWMNSWSLVKCIITATVGLVSLCLYGYGFHLRLVRVQEIAPFIPSY